MTAPVLPRTAAGGVAVLRIGLGVLFLVHGLIKRLVFTPAGTVAYFQSLGLPGGPAYAAMALELLLGVTLILGSYARWLALLGVALLLGTLVSVHGAAGFGFSDAGGGWESPAFWVAALLALSLLGALALRPAR